MHALIAVAAVQAATAVFSPPLDQPIAYATTETREDARGAQRFTVERRVTFRKRTGGYLAIVETLRVDGTAAGGAGKLFQAAMSDMVGRHLRLLLDGQGSVVDVEDRDAEWARQIAALDRALAGGSAARQATVAGLLAPMRALNGPAKVARIAECLDPVLGGAMLRAGPAPSRPATMAGTGPAGSVTLTGTEATTRQPDGGLRFDRRMTSTAMDLADTRNIRPDGLVREVTEIRTLRIGSGTMTITRRTALTP